MNKKIKKVSDEIANTKHIITQNDKYLVSTFREMIVGTFFCNNGQLCIKIDYDRYLTINTNLETTSIIEWDKNDFTEATVVNMQYSYMLRPISGDIG